MSDDPFHNAYADAQYAAAYAALEFRGTYGLAYRDLPMLFQQYVPGTAALDFGCGTGRSTRFLRALGFHVVGADIAPEMLTLARSADPQGVYVLIGDGDLRALPDRRFDLVQALFTFDNIDGEAHRVALLRQLSQRLTPGGVLLLLASSPELYTHEWVSFSTSAFPENLSARSGDRVRIVVTDIDDRRPVQDCFRLEEDYEREFEAAGLDVLRVHRPLAFGNEGVAWVNETRIAPWLIYVLRPQAGS